MSPTAAFEFEALIGGDSPLKEKNKIFQAYHLKRTTNFFFYIDIMRTILKEYEKSGMFRVISTFHTEVSNLP